MIVEQEEEVTRWFVREPFNPASPQQLLAYMEHKGYEGGHNKKSKTGNPSTDEHTLQRLARKDVLFKKILDYRAVQKIEATYATGSLARLGKDKRLHPSFLHKPRNMRLSCVDPNLQNIPDDEDVDSLEREFRRCIVASHGCVMVETDYAGIEAVETGWYCRDPDYVRLASYGIHTYVLSHKLGKPPNLSWDDARLSSYLHSFKQEHKASKQYRGCKVTVHASNYGATPYLLHYENPDLFPTLRSAQEFQDFYFELCPALKTWQAEVRRRAAHDHYLGGADHPYHFKHWFWDVVSWNSRQKKWVHGSDWQRVVAFYPASTAYGVLADASLRLCNPSSPLYVGDFFFGRTPLRALIHDSILAEVPEARLDDYVERVDAAMGTPILVQPNDWMSPEDRARFGSHLRLGVDVKVGPSWGEMEPYRR